MQTPVAQQMKEVNGMHVICMGENTGSVRKTIFYYIYFNNTYKSKTNKTKPNNNSPIISNNNISYY